MAKIINRRMKFPKSYKPQQGKYGLNKTNMENKANVDFIEKVIDTEKNKNPLSEIEIQNPTVKNNQYISQSDSCKTVDTVVPSSMRYDMLKSIETIDRRVNGVDEYVAEKLGYFVGSCSLDQKKEGLKCLCDAFSAEQVDAIAVAIYNIENKGQGCIIGDQTGIGKGRIAAGMIRYAIKQGLKPIFITEKPNLFTDLFRDIVNIGSDDAIPIQILTGTKEVKKRISKSDSVESEIVEVQEDSETEEEKEFIIVDEFKTNKAYPKYTFEEITKEGNPTGKMITKEGKNFCVPFIINSKSEKTAIKDEIGNILYDANNEDINRVLGKKVKTSTDPNTGKGIFETTRGSFAIPEKYSFVLATYSQFNGVNPLKMQFLKEISRNNIVVMDESHNASGSSNVGEFLMGCLEETKGVTFLSATFAKRPDNMPIYASKTAISEANMNSQQLIDAISSGGVALQEIVASSLTSEGQMIRRERSFEGIEVNYEYLDERQMNRLGSEFNKSVEHRAIMDKATDIIRDIMNFQDSFVREIVEQQDKIAAAEYKEVKGTKEKAGVDIPPIFSGVFNIINQLIFSLKAESVAEVAIKRLKEGKKPVIAFASTMESFFDKLQNEFGEIAHDGDVVNSDFSMILKNRLDSVLRMRVADENGNAEYEKINIQEQSAEFRYEYNRILSKIKRSSVGISCSPIDVLINKIESAGYKVAEVTGRNRYLKLMANDKAVLKNRVKLTTNDAFRKFNDNEIDCLMINQSGSTGASAHAIVTKKVPKEKVKQRVMIILQAELNINTEVQKRGRINRTGQILKPIYDYVISSIPAEERLMMMLQKKLKSLDANTTSNQKQSDKLLESDTPDFLNKYGDKLVAQYLFENPSINIQIDDPLKIGKETDLDKINTANASHRVSGRVAILSSKDQEKFYKEISERYKEEISYLISSGEYDLEVENMDLEAETIDRQIAVVGLGGESVFSRNSIIEKVEVNNLRKPLKKDEVEALISESLNGYTPDDLSISMRNKYDMFLKNTILEEEAEISEKYDNMVKNITNEKAFIKIEDATLRLAEIEKRKNTINESKAASLKKSKESYDSKKEYIYGLINFFKVGKVIGYPSINYENNGSISKGIFVGFDIKNDLKNPYAPSAIKLKFALASSQKFISLPASKVQIVDSVISITYSKINYSERDNFLNNWDEFIKDKQSNRAIRYIVTGNILQAFSKKELKGNLISYTTIDKAVKKGILLPEDFSIDNMTGKDEIRTTVPIIKALPIIKSMVSNRSIATTDDFLITREYGDSYHVSVNASRAKGGKYYLDTFLNSLIDGGVFNKKSGMMTGRLPYGKIDELVNYLQDKFRASVNLVKQEFDRIKDSIEDVVYQDEVKQDESVIIEKLTEADRFEDVKTVEIPTKTEIEKPIEVINEGTSKEDLIISLEGAETAIEFLEGDKKQDMIDYVEGLKTLIEIM